MKKVLSRTRSFTIDYGGGVRPRCYCNAGSSLGIDSQRILQMRLNARKLHTKKKGLPPAKVGSFGGTKRGEGVQGKGSYDSAIPESSDARDEKKDTDLWKVESANRLVILKLRGCRGETKFLPMPKKKVLCNAPPAWLKESAINS